ncbi:MAG TPA: flagellar hook-associated protein FlgK [Lacipirellulaceae bacterium]|nr:flagellar hook-associated protein FlgK [Lacipirellulaceae bacterium]
MSLFGSIQMGGNTLQAMQIGLQVVGNNIANANTPGYVRQEAVYAPGPVQRVGGLILGTGVEVDSIVQKLDKFVQERLTGAHGDRANAEATEQTYKDLETVLNELSDSGDLSSAFTNFFDSVDNVLQDPGNAATRNLAVGNGVALAETFNNLHSRVSDLQTELDQRVTSDADQINSLAEQIRKLNIQIASVEGGNSSASEAGGLRVQRQNAIDQLSQLVGIQVTEQPSGGVSVAVGGDFLVFEGQSRKVEVEQKAQNGKTSGVIAFADTHGTLQTTSGEVAGLYDARDNITGGFLDKLDNLAGTLAFEFNKVYSQGQGLVGFQNLTSVESVDNRNAALDAAGLSFPPVSGTFDVLVHSKGDDLTHTHTIHVDLDGLDEDTTLNDLAQQIDAIDGISASVTTTGKLQISADSSDIEFAFSGDTSGALAALGINTFFTGSTAATIGVNNEVKGIDNAGKFAASLGGIGEDSANAERMSAFLDQPLVGAGNVSISDLYTQMLNEVTQGSSVAQSVADGFRTFESTLEGQQQAVSGVSIDDEAVNMLTLQKIYQASARYIATISDLLDTLVKI